MGLAKRIMLLAILLSAASLSGFALQPDRSRTTTATQRLAEQADADGPLSGSVWGFLAVNLRGDTLVCLNPQRRLVPASNLKLITTGAALLSLGEDFRYSTTFATDAPSLPAAPDSTLHGNLYIIGGGDPLLGELFPYLPSPDETFGRWSKVLSDNGIRRIEGDILGDGSWFSEPQPHPDWNVEDLRTRDGVVPAGLTWRGKMGDSLPDSPSTAALHFREWLLQNGIASDSGRDYAAHPSEPGATLDTPDPSIPLDSLLILGTVPSLPLRELVRIANCQSDNFIAETLLKTLGKLRGDGDDYPSSIAALRKSLAPIGLMAASGQMRFADGSGLSRKNYVSPEFMVSFLKGMYRSRARKAFMASLPFAGEPKTTLENRLPKRSWALRHRILMKSGSMNGVRCFSGYILPSSGRAEETIVFSLLTNNAVASSSQVYPLLDSLIESLAGEN
ncbi:MAG: D-alanyl-D-alanine carboxypeptidase [Bacteroidales bacterium]|nr:D-alanyl-D-alanine carboxypeptidase [Bacteroidales bacterium]